jgi:hypothetical protein
MPVVNVTAGIKILLQTEIISCFQKHLTKTAAFNFNVQ